MDVGYNITKLEDIIKKVILKSINQAKDMQLLLSELMEEKECTDIDLESRKALSNYSKEAIHWTLEKMILLSLENNCPCWNLLKVKTEEMRTRILSHFFITFIADLKNNSFVYEETKDIAEIRNLYDKKVENILDVFSDDLKETIDSKKSITLNHMHNLNANGRTVSLNGTKIGGLFLSKNSNIGYAKFVNKKDLLSSFKVSTSKKEIALKGGTINVYDFKKIVNSLNQTLKVEKNTKIKNQDARLISTENKKIESLFLGNKGIDLENGTYISVEELNFALNDYLRKKELVKEKEKTSSVVVNRKGKIKKVVAIAALAGSIFGMLPTNVSGLEPESKLHEEQLDEDLTIKNIQQNQMKAILNEEIKPLEEKVQTISSNTVVSELVQGENEIPSMEVEKKEESVVQEEKVIEEILSSVSDNNIKDTSLEKEQIKENLTKDKIIEEKTVELEKEETSFKLEKKIDNEQIPEEVFPLESDEIVKAESGQDIVNYAMQFVGNPYVYGGESLTNGADCSGFTMEVYSHFGIEIPRTSDNQRSIGIDIEGLENALPGDLICYDGHVAIYIGDGNIVHAANRMDGIKISKATCEEILAIKRVVELQNINEGKKIGGL